MKLALITIRDEIKNMYIGELKSVFDDFLEIVPYSLEIDHKYKPDTSELLDVDLILLTNPKIYSLVSGIVNPNAQIIYLDYAFLKNKIESFGELPQNTKALICFNFYEVSVQAATTIYEMGYNNIEIGIYNPDQPEDYRDYDIAIVGESSAIVPEYIDRIFSLGRRKISFKTLLDIATKANLFSDVLENKIYKYSLDIASPQDIITHLYGNEHNSKSHLNAIMDSIDYSIVIIDEDTKIINHNKQFKDLMKTDNSLVNKSLYEFPKLKPFISHLNDEIVENLIVDTEDSKRVMLTIKKILNNYMENNIYILLMKDVTDIFKLEKSLRKQIEKKGYISKYDFDDIYGKSDSILECKKKAYKISKMENSVLILGESGTGKEIFAQSIHNNSSRKAFPFIGINCAALPSTLLESELFGYSEGTFTGARKGGKKGLFELADNGTLFLDEIGDMSMEVQAKILRVLEEKEFMRLGSGEVISVNVRIIAATNKDLQALIKENRFRLDLYYRLNTFMFTIPPLRERSDDIGLLVKLFSSEFNNKDLVIPDNVMKILIDYPWYGNVRELKSCIEYLFAMSDDEVNIKSLPDHIRNTSKNLEYENSPSPFDSISDYDKDIMENILILLSQNGGGGRRMLHSKLKENFSNLSEYKVRNYLGWLKENDFVNVSSGPTGITLSQMGISYFQEYLK